MTWGLLSIVQSIDHFCSNLNEEVHLVFVSKCTWIRNVVQYVIAIDPKALRDVQNPFRAEGTLCVNEYNLSISPLHIERKLSCHGKCMTQPRKQLLLSGMGLVRYLHHHCVFPVRNSPNISVIDNVSIPVSKLQLQIVILLSNCCILGYLLREVCLILLIWSK